MNINFKHYRSATAIIVALSLSACVRFDTRMQANGSFDYQKSELITPYQTGDFSNDEMRNNFDLPPLSDGQIAVGFHGEDVDIRPPTQFMAIIDGVLLESTPDDKIKVLFNSFNQDEDMQNKVWFLINSYLSENNVEVVEKDDTHIQTGIFVDTTTYGSFVNKNTVEKKSSYNLTVQKEQNGHTVAVTVDALTYAEKNESADLKINLVGSTKQEIELRFVNNLLRHAYFVKASEQLASANTQPLTIKLGFDDNHQSAWIVEDEFIETWRKLPALFTLLNFELVDADKNLGYFLLNYSKPSDSYWDENDLQPFELDNGEYFVQLGEVTGGTTSIVWLDEDKKPLTDQKVSEIYISITEHVRGALLENDKQTKEF
ncbi:outer membrane protein assembly factor BamC [Psychromonas marina]|uniref:Outer membrane protein assembly factor BamC n=1 Tax=Psychromonas marina TaxID=88364 RepID=A0ABQ6E4K9_9GAMM|nr:outer membrane protein assembly factor BamC [Psychromonas marina]GLS92358.1 outer membrane protein assembly factor BamC [Psychromonas marina]